MTERETLKKTFDEFLKKHRVYGKYYQNIRTSNLTVEWMIENVIKNNEEDMLISGAFGWLNTPEGDDFWSNIDYLWREYYDKIIAGVNEVKK